MSLLSYTEAAQRLSVSRRTIERLTTEGALPKVRISPGRVGIPEQAVINYIEGGGWQSVRIADAGWSNSSKGESAYSNAVRPESRKRKRRSSKRGSGGSGSTATSSATKRI